MMPRTESPPIFFEGPPDEFIRKLSLIIRELLDGKSNNASVVTLTPGTTSTKITNNRYSSDTIITLTPQSSSAAATQATGTIWTESHKGEIEIHHDSQPDTDRTYGIVVVG